MEPKRRKTRGSSAWSKRAMKDFLEFEAQPKGVTMSPEVIADDDET